MSEAITTWLDPLRSVLDPTRSLDWPRLHELAVALDTALSAHPVGSGLPPAAKRSRRLLAIRAALAEQGHLDTTGQDPLCQLFVQFVCGYRDLDLRDASGLGHGRLIARHGTPTACHRWIPRLQAGDLAGIAVTDRGVTHPR
ncbi:MAG TPA: hypothetical protein VJT49_26910 [Amycolatopsis sp.]|uniref:hypothetical protein n=1 Tax=Amycolatopsis sp. TaxID=37632 RepID=UPI002B47EE18|nr:hypothetical protein [Amycolatopsis sp.]HKS48672.1 hypothetical protein [Amycolatopsis sp.]